MSQYLFEDVMGLDPESLPEASVMLVLDLKNLTRFMLPKTEDATTVDLSEFVRRYHAGELEPTVFQIAEEEDAAEDDDEMEEEGAEDGSAGTEVVD